MRESDRWGSESSLNLSPTDRAPTDGDHKRWGSKCPSLYDHHQTTCEQHSISSALLRRGLDPNDLFASKIRKYETTIGRENLRGAHPDEDLELSVNEVRIVDLR